MTEPDLSVRNLVVVSDLHIGCRLALVHPDGAHLDDGGQYRPSHAQAVLWSWWREFWDEWIPHWGWHLYLGMDIYYDALRKTKALPKDATS